SPGPDMRIQGKRFQGRHGAKVNGGMPKEPVAGRLVRKAGLEPARLAAPAPKAGASTNSATFAISAPLAQGASYSRGPGAMQKKLVRAPVGRRALSAGSRFSLGRTSMS